MKNFESFMASQLDEYISYRENLGYSIRVHRHDLLRFDQYLKEKDADWDSLQPLFFLDLKANLRLEARSVNRVLCTIRVFFKFLMRRGYVGENPLVDIPLLRGNTIVPFIFSSEQTDRLLGTICKSVRRTESYFLKDLTIYLALLLLARCGLRISEPLRLRLDHYRTDDGTIYIEKTKFRKDRLIPVPIAVMREIENYLSVRKRLLPNDQNPYLLAGRNQNTLCDQLVRSAFHKAVKDIKLDQPRRVIGNMNFSQPTPHSLRHSFAVNTLRAIKKRGESLRHALPILAAYMGHRTYKHTTVYLRVADALSRKILYDFTLWKGL
jgi:site-specific recombinase XerD